MELKSGGGELFSPRRIYGFSVCGKGGKEEGRASAINSWSSSACSFSVPRSKKYWCAAPSGNAQASGTCAIMAENKANAAAIFEDWMIIVGQNKSTL